jgi:hypothetical protein
MENCEISLYEDPNKRKDLSNLQGFIYELYCYNYLLENFKDIRIIKSHIIKNGCFGNFHYSKYGAIEFWSNNMILSEFDAIGIKKKTIQLFEITKNLSGAGELKRRLFKKEYLLKNSFKGYDIEITIISTKFDYNYNKYGFIVIPEPDCQPYIDNEIFIFNKHILKCETLRQLNNIASNYDYIDDLIKISNKYFKQKINIERIKKLHLFNKFYNIKNEEDIEYYDLYTNVRGKYKILQGNLYDSNDKLIVDDERSLSEITAIINWKNTYKNYFE